MRKLTVCFFEFWVFKFESGYKEFEFAACNAGTAASPSELALLILVLLFIFGTESIGFINSIVWFYNGFFPIVAYLD